MATGRWSSMSLRRSLASFAVFGALVLGALVLGALVAAAPASAQSVCGARTEMVKQLENRYAESRRAIGLASNGTLLEVFASTSGTWTVLMSFPDGRACMMANGDAWRQLPGKPGGEAV